MSEFSKIDGSVMQYADQMYAGVVGKLIGVYLGRAVEGWSYEAIQKTFGEINYYVNDKVNWPLIVPDDDLSGTFLFYRAMEDNGSPADIKAATIGDTWLNYIVEDKTVLWWGGLGRSTEHTAYLRLKNGIKAPMSGSAKLNSVAMAEAIGSEIFIDTWALINPANPERAAAMAREASYVSHDGIAVEAAALLAAMEAQAFVERDINKLLDLGLSMTQHPHLIRSINDLREQCAKANHWRDVRDWLERNHSYGHYAGPCPMMPNHLLLLASFIMGGDNVQEGLKIAVSSGWDTDCNAGNLACLNGIRLGIDAFNVGPDLRGPVADRLYVVGADGGECLSDAVQETRRVLRVATKLNGETYDEPKARFSFEYPGSVQGFETCPLHIGNQTVTRLGNLNEDSDENGLAIEFANLATGVTGSLSVPTFIDPKPRALSETSYFEVLASPSIYGTQTLRAKFKTFGDAIPNVRFYVIFYNGDGKLEHSVGEVMHLRPGVSTIEWQVPDVGGLPIHRVGIELTSDARISGKLGLLEMDWKGAPKAFVMGSVYDLSPRITPFDTSSYWLKSFVSSAKNFAPDVASTFCLSHPTTNGIATTGSRDWVDYAVTSRLTLDLHKGAGLVARARGHRRYYAGRVTDGKAQIVRRRDDAVDVLAEVPVNYAEHDTLDFRLAVSGDSLEFSVGDRARVTAKDSSYVSGGAGFYIDEGTVPARGFAVHAL
ncbi:ADP-ribosylglycohydrolase family protein [Devosia sp. CN2-171]|uniref:ADP-ribosylglycohydrolase family protein n=1 Tax=Devosia sp. CN2-171 TaxID=3400909 RepID=UPI003BF83A7B